MLNEFETHMLARRRSPNTIRLRLVYVRQLAARCDLAEATARDLEALLVSHPEWKPETVNAAIVSWRVFYRWALRNAMVATDPTADLELVHAPHTPRPAADDAAIRAAILDATLHQRAVLLLGRECGLRRNEIATLRTDMRVGDWLTIIGKGGRARRVHIDVELRDSLDELEQLQGDGYYFPVGDHHISVETVYKMVCRLIGTPTHSLRRGAIKSVYEGSGRDIRLAQEFAGHSKPETTAIYLNVSDDDLERAGGYASLAA